MLARRAFSAVPICATKRLFTTSTPLPARLADKVAIITGGSDGIGKESSYLFAKHGAKVVVVDINTKKGEEVVDQIKKWGGVATFVQADVSKASDVEKMINLAEKAYHNYIPLLLYLDYTRYGKVNIIFNNAGVMLSEDDDAVSTSEATWDKTMNVNLKGVFLGCKFGIPALQRAGGGSIINTASFVAKLGAATPQVAYTASKGGVLSMTKELAVIHARQNIRVNALCPGPLRTDLLDKFLDTEEKRQRRLVHIPMGRFGKAEEIAQTAVFLASDESSFITGAEFLVDGGITAAYVTPK